MAPRKKTNLNFSNNARVAMKGGYVTHDIILFKRIEHDETVLHSFGNIDDLTTAIDAIKESRLSVHFIGLYKTYDDNFLKMKIDANEIASIEEI
jgi:hypothetical protein